MSMQNPDAELLFAPYSNFTREMWNNRVTLRSLMKPRKNVIMKKPAGKPAGKIAKKPASNGGAKKTAAQKSTMTKKPASRRLTGNPEKIRERLDLARLLSEAVSHENVDIDVLEPN